MHESDKWVIKREFTPSVLFLWLLASVGSCPICSSAESFSVTSGIGAVKCLGGDNLLPGVLFPFDGEESLLLSRFSRLFVRSG